MFGLEKERGFHGRPSRGKERKTCGIFWFVYSVSIGHSAFMNLNLHNIIICRLPAEFCFREVQGFHVNVWLRNKNCSR